MSTRKYRLSRLPGRMNCRARCFGCVRHAYHHYLEAKVRAHEQTGKPLSRFELQVETKHMKTGKPWLKEAPGQSPG